MKTYQKVSEILDRVRDYHHELGNIYHRLESPGDSRRLDMLLMYLGRHERSFERALARYEEVGRKAILDTWFQYIPDEHLNLHDFRADPDLSFDELVSTVLELDEKLVRFYTRMARSASSTDLTRHFFENLAEQEKQEKAQLKVTAEMILDM